MAPPLRRGRTPFTVLVPRVYSTASLLASACPPPYRAIMHGRPCILHAMAIGPPRSGTWALQAGAFAEAGRRDGVGERRDPPIESLVRTAAGAAGRRSRSLRALPAAVMRRR